MAGATPAISALCEVEFASVVARRIRERSLSAADGAKVLRAFDAHVDERRFRQLPVVSASFVEAGRMLRAGGTPLSTLDALHLAVVIAGRESLCTADRQLSRAAAKCGVQVRLIRS